MLLLKTIGIFLLAFITGWALADAYGWVGVPLSAINGYLLGNLLGRIYMDYLLSSTADSIKNQYMK